MPHLSQSVGQYREWAPAAPLGSHVCCVWVNDLSQSSATDYDVVPDGCVDIIWTGGSLCVAGPDTRPIREQMAPGHCVSGVRFHPGTAYSWLDTPLSEILNVRVPLAEFWGEGQAGRLKDRLDAVSDPAAAAATLEQALLERLGRVADADRQVAFLRRCAGAAATDSDVIGVRELALRMGVSERTLRRRCLEAFGYGFKTLQRILRFQRLFRQAAHSPVPNLADLAMETGFADQAHMSREVQRLSNATPAQFVAELAGMNGRFVQDGSVGPG